MRRVYLVIGTPIVALAIATQAGAARGKATVSAHSLINEAHQTVVAWRTTTGYAVAIQGTTDAGVVSGNSLTYWSAGQRREVIRFHDGGLEKAFSTRFGVTKHMVDRAIGSSPRVSVPSPFVRRPSDALSRIPAVLTTVDDYGKDTEQLARVAPFAVRFAGPSIVGKQLAHLYIANVTNPFQGGPYHSPTNSGPIVTIVYSSDPAHLGNGDHQLTLTFTSESSDAGQANATFLGGGRESIKVNGIVAFKANENQLVFRLGRVIAVATSTLQPSDAQWETILSALKSL